MKSKRIGALIIAVSLLAGMFPVSALAAGPDTVDYVRLNPEVSILNRYTGANTKVYESLMSDGSFFNAISLFTIYNVDEHDMEQTTNETAKYSDIIAGKNLIFEDFDQSVLNKLSLTRGNLQANVSATFHNHLHRHRTGTFTYRDILAFSGLDFLVTGDYIQRLNGKSKRNETNPRLGNMDFHTLISDENGSMKLKYTNSFIFYEDKVCTCKGHYVTKTVVAFKDERAPRLNGVVFKNNQGEIVKDGTFGRDDTITIVVAYDEPIRFADDEKKHGDLHIKLQVDGVTPDSYPKAYLKKLDKDVLYFEYRVPDEAGIFQEITGVDLSPLMGEGIPLVQLYGGGGYTINPPEGVETVGFSTTTSYITDLAGNAITEKTAIRKAYIDTRELKIDKINLSFVANNQDVKEALGKTNPDDKDYLDASDNHLGVGDRVTASLVMNKKLHMGSAYPGSISYRKLKAYTNWKDGNGDTVVVESRWANPVLADSGTEVTGIELEPIIIRPDMHCADGENEPLKITKVEFVDNIPFEDLAGNKYTQLELSGLNIPISDCFIDTKVPDVSSTAPSSGAGADKIYAVIPIAENARQGTFRFPFKLTDASGVEELKGSFSWHVEDVEVPFEYVVKATALLDGEETWQAGSNGMFCEFIQTGTEQNVFIRPLENREYDFGDTELLFHAKDYAGNHHLQEGETPARFKIDAAWDNVPPTAKAGSVTRNPKAGGGWTLTVDMLLEDYTALKADSVAYKWLDEKPDDPLTMESIGGDHWTPAELIFDAGTLRSGTAKATETVDSGTRFSKHLVARAKDTSDNESVTYLGKYEYDLTAIDYALSYSSAITSKASLKIEDIQEKIDGTQAEGVLLFIMPVPIDDDDYDPTRPDEYFVSLYKATEPILPIPPEPGIRDVFHEHQDGFTTTWIRMRVGKIGETYSFKAETWETTEAEGLKPEHRFNLTEFAENLGKSTDTFCGEIPITVLAGPEDAFSIEDLIVYKTNHGPYPTTASGVSDEEFVLRVSSPYADLDKSFTGMSIATNSAINIKYAPGFWEVADRGKPMLSSAEGVEFLVDLGADVNGWNFEDVDYANSYVELEHKTSSESFKVNLASSPVQTVVFPKDDYKTGYYSVRLVVACKAGKGYTLTLNEQMYIDSTPPVQDFGISSLTYAEKNYQNAAPWHDVDGSTNHFANTEKIYLPVHASTGAAVENIMKVKIEEVTGIPLPSTYVVAWNATAGMTTADAVDSITIESGGECSFMLTAHDSSADAKTATGPTTIGNKEYINIGIVKNLPNTIGIQVFSANGKESAIRYYVIHPVAEGVKGSLSVTQGKDGSNVASAGNLIFTPNQGQVMVGTDVYVSVGYYKSGVLTKKIDPLGQEDFIGQEMTAQADGTYTYPLLAGRESSERFVYSVYAIDAFGNLTLLGELDTAVVDHEAPIISAISSSTSDGLYEAKFKIEDDTLYAANLQGEDGWSRLYQPMEISLRFDKDHAEWLGVHENTRLDLTLNESEEVFFWEATGSSETGLYKVIAERKKADGADAWDTPHWLEVTVKGIVGYREAAAGHEVLKTFDLIMDARDALGNSTAGTPGAVTISNPENIKPLAITSGPDAPAYVDTGVGKDKALQLTFNFPVLPEASWICPEPKYGQVQKDAFPITDDGNWTISYSDIFGKSYEQDLSLMDIFEEYGMALSINPLEPVNGDVEVLVRNVEKDPDGTFTVSGLSDTPSRDMKITVTDNQSVVIVHEPYEDQLKVTINNIIKGTPEAEPLFYFEANGTEYTIDTVPKNDSTPGDVRVWYRTSRNVIPTDGTGSSYTFKYGGNTSHTFTYKDDFNNEGQLTVSLTDLGITLTEPGAPTPDTTAPRVTVALSAKRFGTYRPEESFGDYTNAAGIKDAFEAVHYVQGYLLALDVYDQSSYKVVVKNDTPDSIAYADAASDVISGISVAGNAIIIDKNKGTALEDFTIVVVDNAKEETGAGADNFTCLELKASDMVAWFDNTAPHAEVQGKWLTLYAKDLFVRLTDKADNDAPTPLVTLDSPKLDKETDVASLYKDWYKRTFMANGNDYLVFYDMAGNMGTQFIEVANIDETVPELSTTWSPYYTHPATPSENDPGSPPEGPLNTDVAATISCSTNIETVTAEYSGDRGSTWVDGSAPEDQALKDKVSYKYSANQIFVTFSDDGCGIRLTVTAPNGKTATMPLFLNEGVIDRGQPNISPDVDYQYRVKSGGGSYAVPYAAKIILAPDKPSYCANAGQAETLYSSSKPLVITTYANETKTYTFVDKAGNQSEIEVATTGMDSTPPTLTVDPVNTIGLKMTSGSAQVKIKSNEAGTAECNGATTPLIDLTANTEKTISFTENGVYLIKVYDLAGNSDSISVVVGNIDRTAPKLSFDEGTVRLLQDSSVNELKALLDTGVTAWDSETPKASDLDVTYALKDDEGYDVVKLDTPGLYAVTYTVKDPAGNEGVSIRFVKVIDKDLPYIVIDRGTPVEKTMEPEETTILSTGDHTLLVEGLKEIAPGVLEPYTLKIRRGIATEGQMKYFVSTVPVAADGRFTVSKEGFYTVYIVTQSRRSVRTLLYVER